MRSEQEIFDLILKVANEDSRVRAVGMNGSRTNPRVPKDPFQDYDIVYLVTDMQSFITDANWVNVFGERIIMQTPEGMTMFPPSMGKRFPYLMLFADGNRIDLIITPIEEKDQYCYENGLTIILLDKDGIMPAIPDPTEEYWVKKPSAEYFADCCNEFWWVSTYVAKGLWRKEILYAYDHLNIVRSMLLKMIECKVGINTNFSVSVGKNSKYLKQYIDEVTWGKLLQTLPSGDYDHHWNALFAMCELFEEVATEVADKLSYIYPIQEATKVKQYLKHVQTLDSDATEIY